MTKYKRILTVSMVLLLCFFSLFACSAPKSDEELIESKINQFLKAYNSGDMDAVLECLAARTKNQVSSAMKIAQAIGGAVPKVGGILGKISISDLFGVSVGMVSDDDILTISDTTINIVSDTKATVDVVLGYKDKLSDTQGKAFFTMVKEDNDWFIKNLEGK